MEALRLPLSEILTLVITLFPFKTHLRTRGICCIPQGTRFLCTVRTARLGYAATAPRLLLLLLLSCPRRCAAALILEVPPPTFVAPEPVGVLLSGGVPTGGTGIGGLEFQGGGHEALQRLVLERPYEAPNFGRAKGIHIYLLHPFFSHERGGSRSLQREGFVEAGNAPALAREALEN